MRVLEPPLSGVECLLSTVGRMPRPNGDLAGPAQLLVQNQGALLRWGGMVADRGSPGTVGAVDTETLVMARNLSGLVLLYRSTEHPGPGSAHRRAGGPPTACTAKVSTTPG